MVGGVLFGFGLMLVVVGLLGGAGLPPVVVILAGAAMIALGLVAGRGTRGDIKADMPLPGGPRKRTGHAALDDEERNRYH